MSTANRKLQKKCRSAVMLAGRGDPCLLSTVRHLSGFTLVEMLVAMAITLVMMGAVVTLFANISSSVTRRRATIEMSSQLRHVRNVLQQDLQGATCPGVTWQRPESNHGYIEIVEGQYHDGYPSKLLDADPNNTSSETWPPKLLNPEIDHAASTIPSSNLAFKVATWATDGAGLGDFDDVLMLTSRNEREPFVGRIPSKVRLNNRSAERFDRWEAKESIQSPLAEVVWFAIENPGFTEDPPVNDPTASRFFGEPGYRTVYRRTLLIAPWLNPYRHTDANGAVADTFSYDGGNFKAQPGLLRILPSGNKLTLAEAIASLIAFQDRYDISARLEWDAHIDNGKGRWKIMANTLGDLTKRENRFCHFGYYIGPSDAVAPSRNFPFQFETIGSKYPGSKVDVNLAIDPEATKPTVAAKATGYLTTIGAIPNAVGAYGMDDKGSGYVVRPFAYISNRPEKPSGRPRPRPRPTPNPTAPSTHKTVDFAVTFVPATAQAILNDDGSVVRVVHGPVPLWGQRRGEDVMMTDVLAFDLRVYDPGAPVFATVKKLAPIEYDVVLTPGDAGWRGSAPTGSDGAYMSTDNMGNASGTGIGTVNANTPPQPTSMLYVGQGAYVDLGYGYDPRFKLSGQPIGMFPEPKYADSFVSARASWFFDLRGLNDVYGYLKSPGYCVYDTWSFHYENDGIDQDQSGVVDQGTNGLDDNDFGTHDPDDEFDLQDFAINGVDDVRERETSPPYDKPLRGMQALIRTYERDSRAIRQVRVNQHFMQE